MIAVDEAWRLIAAAMPARRAMPVPVGAAAGRILAQDICAERDQPPFDRVMMDGIAIDAAALDSGIARLRRQAVQAAGARRLRLADRHHCIEIMTGAALPENANTIVPVEQLRTGGDHIELLAPEDIRHGQFIHARGSDYARGDALLASGTRLGAPEMAVLASCGLAEVAVASAPAVAVIAVGDELVDPGAPIDDVQIRRSNDFAIAAALAQRGLAVASQTRLPDDPAVLERDIGAALEAHDVLVLSGGVSMGKFDYIPAIMEALGVRIVLHKVAQRPGKPMWIGKAGGKVVFALPGNPVSALVCARRYLLPAIDASMGCNESPQWVPLAVSTDSLAKLTWFMPVNLDNQGAARQQPMNTSGDFNALAGTAGFVELAPGSTFRAGTPVPLWRW